MLQYSFNKKSTILLFILFLTIFFSFLSYNKRIVLITNLLEKFIMVLFNIFFPKIQLLTMPFQLFLITCIRVLGFTYINFRNKRLVIRLVQYLLNIIYYFIFENLPLLILVSPMFIYFNENNCLLNNNFHIFQINKIRK